ncbi:phosphonate C-P lyase system protein PhnG [Vagococcus sp. WN89Y]|uniref:phosphonate C-P lyase system protein PhnG n=1 Tax=Vagococcus sp. WN89Y TaxID=3457258 RepID=UPI003FCD1645
MSLIKKRQYWMSILARSQATEIISRWAALDFRQQYKLLRPTQIGLIQLQGRMEVSGQRFMLGDMTVTRAAVEVSDGTVGYSYIIGRDKTKAELCAVIDALLQKEAYCAHIIAAVIEPLAQRLRETGQKQRQDVAPSKVNFYNLVRGEDQ